MNDFRVMCRRFSRAGLVFFMLLSGCVSTDDASTNAKNTAETRTAKEAAGNAAGNSGVDGTYYARLPCADCPGVRVDLVLSGDGFYEAMLATVGAEDEAVFQSGQWVQADNRVQLMPSNSESAGENAGENTEKSPNSPDSPNAGMSALGTTSQFQIDNNGLILLNAAGQPYDGDAANAYRFERK